MDQFCLDPENIKRVYNWFYHGFPDFKNNEICESKDVTLMKKMELYILENEQWNKNKKLCPMPYTTNSERKRLL